MHVTHKSSSYDSGLSPSQLWLFLNFLPGTIPEATRQLRFWVVWLPTPGSKEQCWFPYCSSQPCMAQLVQGSDWKFFCSHGRDVEICFKEEELSWGCPRDGMFTLKLASLQAQDNKNSLACLWPTWAYGHTIATGILHWAPVQGQLFQKRGYRN